MHQLFAAFLRETEPSDEEQAELVRVRTAQRRRFVALALAAEVEENPADAQKASRARLVRDWPV